jgi:hypothetical protein
MYEKEENVERGKGNGCKEREGRERERENVGRERECKKREIKIGLRVGEE